MISKTRLLASTLVLSLGLSTTVTGCDTSGPERTERWVSTNDTNVKIDWDKVNEAYKKAEGPEDLERRVNEIYEGKEIISISVQDSDDKSQVVTGFFDRNTDGQVAEDEKIFTITRNVTGEGEGQYQTAGYGHYAGYHSPMMSIMTGMMLGSMMSSMFMPRYVPMAYTTSGARAGQIASTRSSYRAANPSKFQKSKSGRSYNRPSSSGRSSGRRFGGGRFGLARAGRTVRPTLLTA